MQVLISSAFIKYVRRLRQTITQTTLNCASHEGILLLPLIMDLAIHTHAHPLP